MIAADFLDWQCRGEPYIHTVRRSALSPGSAVVVCFTFGWIVVKGSGGFVQVW